MDKPSRAGAGSPDRLQNPVEFAQIAEADGEPALAAVRLANLYLGAELGAKLGTKVQIRQTHGGKGRLTIGFRDLGELDRILKSIG